MTTDISEKGLESLITAGLLDKGWVIGSPQDYDRAWTVDLSQLRAFITETQAPVLEALDIDYASATRQVRSSQDEAALALDLGLFLNGLPIATFELKNSLTKQTVDDAVDQYKRDRDPREKLFELGRCIAHFAVDDAEVRYCTHQRAKRHGSCLSTSVGTTVLATHRTLSDLRRITCGERCSRRSGSQISSSITRSSSKRPTQELVARNANSFFRVTTSSM